MENKNVIWDGPFFLFLMVLLAGGYLAISWYDTAALLQKTERDRQILAQAFSSARSENQRLNEGLYSERQRNASFSDQINQITGTVNTLVKLKNTDRELLQKYSKVYFLNEHYEPADLVAIRPDFLANGDKNIQINANVEPKLNQLIMAANEASTTLRVASAFRSFANQAAVKSTYALSYGLGANKFSADQGYSEHQLGTAVDFSSVALRGKLSGFDKDPSFKWLNDNAYKYGFALSYPQQNKYYQFEPWHWRFVGVALATRLHNEGKYFYDLDQRTIDTYLVNIFD